jgi:hypothetical protein
MVPHYPPSSETHCGDVVESGKTTRRRFPTICRVVIAVLAYAITSPAYAQGSEQGKLAPVFPGPIAQLGKAVAIDGDTAVVVATQGTFVFVRGPHEPNVWIQEAVLPIGLTNARVDISGDTVIVGDVDAIGGGFATIFERNHGGPKAWGEVARLLPTVLETGNWFGWSVAIHGDIAVVGAIEKPAAFWVGPSEAGPGSAYVFERNRGGPNAWGEVQRLRASDGEGSYLGGPGDEFGYDVAVSEDVVLVGAPGDDVVPTTGGRLFEVGAVYAFTRDRAAWTWQETAKLTAAETDAGDQFGFNIGLDARTAIIIANANPLPGTRTQGAAYIFKREASAWRQAATLRPSDADPTDDLGILVGFGTTVSISHDIAVVNGSELPIIPGLSAGRGTVYVFLRDPDTDSWREVMKIIASDSEQQGAFGVRVGISGTTVIIGAPGGLVDSPGAAYVCELEAITGASAPCRRQTPDVTGLVTISNLTTACCDSSQFTISAVFTNTSDEPIFSFFLDVIELTGGNVLLNADGGPGGRRLTPDVGDGVLSPGEAVSVQFVIALASRDRFQFWVNPRGERDP